MYKLMLVDDEDEVREGIEATVDFESCGFTLCAQATGAIDAIEKAGQFQPDVVFTDVHMPYMDGMEMISRLQEMYPTMKYIVLSGYDDFIYVKQALQRQVLDYLLKPLSAQGIMKVLRRVKEQLDEQARQRVDLEHLREKAAQDAQLARRAAILEYIMGASGGDTHALCARPQMAEDLLEFPLCVSVLSLERSEENLEVLRRDFDSQPALLDASVQEVLDEVLKRHSGEYVSYRGQFILLLPGRQDAALSVCDDAIQLLRHYLHLTATAGISAEITGYMNLGEGYQNALAALDKRLIGGQGRVYAAKKTDAEAQVVDAELGECIRRVTALCRSGQKEEINAFYAELAQRIAHDEIGPTSRQMMMIQLLSAILDAAGRSGVDITQAFSAFRAELVFQPAELSAGMDQLCALTLFVADSVRQEVATSGSEMIARAVQYVRQNYPDKELSLESLCQTFGVSQTQFSLLFKRETGTSFLQYLLDLRIEKAQSLLAESNQKIYQIAEETGFGDASYFSYCFKQRCGLSPKEFRIQRGTTG